ncbi:MAG: alpha/beta fold hydrolase [Geminicoccales bacterium]
MTIRSVWLKRLAVGLACCLVGQGCTAGLTKTLINVSSADVAYDGSLEAFANFVETNDKDWPLPSVLRMFDGSGGAKLRYAHWSAANPAEREGVVVFFQGRTEFIEKNIYTYRDFVERNYDVWTLDWRGQGMSERLLKDEPDKGHINSFDTYLADAEVFLRDVVKLQGIDDVDKVLVAHSMGGAIGTLYLMEHPEAFDKAVFSSPMTKLPGGVDNRVIRAGNKAKNATTPAACVGFFSDCSWSSSFKDLVDVCAIVDQSPATHLLDLENTARYSHDYQKIAENECLIGKSRANNPNLGLGGTTSGWLHEAFVATDKISANKGRLQTPLLIVAGGNDDVVSNPGQAEFCDIDNPFCCRIEVEGAGHEVLIEEESLRLQFFDAFDIFVSEQETSESFCASRD